VLFATLAKWYSSGIVPSESELRKNIAELIGKMSFVSG